LRGHLHCTGLCALARIFVCSAVFDASCLMLFFNVNSKCHCLHVRGCHSHQVQPRPIGCLQSWPAHWHAALGIRLLGPSLASACGQRILTCSHQLQQCVHGRSRGQSRERHVKAVDLSRFSGWWPHGAVVDGSAKWSKVSADRSLLTNRSGEPCMRAHARWCDVFLIGLELTRVALCKCISHPSPPPPSNPHACGYVMRVFVSAGAAHSKFDRQHVGRMVLVAMSAYLHIDACILHLLTPILCFQCCARVASRV